MRSRHSRLLLAITLAVPGTFVLTASPAVAAETNLALGKATSASTSVNPYNPPNVTDGNQGSYWESNNNQFPQWVQVDLGSAVDTNKVVLKLPTANWGTRTETLSVQGSTNGTSFSDLVGSGGRVFDPNQSNTVTLTYGSTLTRYVRVNITGNTGWPAGQLSEVEIYGAPGGDGAAPSAPAGLAFTEQTPGQVKLTWNASSDNVGVTGYDVYANGQLRGSVAGNVLTYTDPQPTSATVSYVVRAKDAAGNISGDSNTVTRQGTGTFSNLAAGKPVTASSTVFTFLGPNANDGNLATYWESAGGAYPATLAVDLGGKGTLDSVLVKLNPDQAWGARTQKIGVEGRNSSTGAWTTLAPTVDRNFNPSSGNSVTIPVSGTYAQVRLVVTSNTGAPGAQVAEFEVRGTPAPSPDLTVGAVTWTPASPTEATPVTFSATVTNSGTAASVAGKLDFLVNGQKVGSSVDVGALNVGQSATVTLNAGARPAGTYAVSAKADSADDNVELNETNNTGAAASLVVAQVASSDIVPTATTWSPGNPQPGTAVSFSVALGNLGTQATAGGAHAITVEVLDANNAVVKTLNGTYTGAIAPGQTAAPTPIPGTWTVASGRFSIRTTVADDANEVAAKRANNTSTQGFYAGRGANLPFDHIEAEDGSLSGGAALVGPNRKIGDLAGEASGRKAVTLNTTGAAISVTTKAPTNTLVTRFSLPDAPGGGGTTSTLNIYVNDVFLKAIDLTSKYTWMYGNEASPNNSPGSGGPRHIYDEANVLLGTTVPAGSKITLKKDAANTSTYAIDFIDTELATAIGNPDATKYAVPAGFTHQDVQNALDQARQSSTLLGVYLPPGDYQTSNKFQVYGKAVKVVGAGPWYTRFHTPAGQENTDAGFRTEASSNGSSFSGFAFFGNYTSRIDGPGKVFDFTNVSNMTVDNIWVEHMICMFWGTNVDNSTIKNSRVRDTWADGVNLTNGSSNNLVSNIESRTSGDDSFALFPAIDGNGGQETGNVFENLTSLLTWRAAGLAVYGGAGNTFRNLLIADTLTYSGLTIATLQFGGIPALGFEAPNSVFENISLIRDGGHFWGQQTFPALWLFSGEFPFQAIRINNVDIVDPTYHGIMFQTKYNGGPLKPIQDLVLTNVRITGAQKSGDEFDAKSGFGIWVNELPEPGQGPAVGTATFNGLTFANNFQNIKNTTSTFTITQNP